MKRAASALGCGGASGNRIDRRWAVTSAVIATAMTSAQPIPSSPMARPLNTDVIANATPFAVPTRPFARSRPSSGTRSVTVVDRATARRLPAIAPVSTSTTSAQKAGLVRSRNDDSGESENRTAASVKVASEIALDRQHRRAPEMPVHEGAEGHAGDGDEEHVPAADDRGGEHRQGLQVDPERQREPQEVVGHARGERVGHEQVEDARAIGRRGGVVRSIGGHGSGVLARIHRRVDERRARASSVRVAGARCRQSTIARWRSSRAGSLSSRVLHAASGRRSPPGSRRTARPSPSPTSIRRGPPRPRTRSPRHRVRC